MKASGRGAVQRRYIYLQALGPIIALTRQVWCQAWSVRLACVVMLFLGVVLTPARAEVVLTSHQAWPLLLRDSAEVLLDRSGHLDLAEVRQLAADGTRAHSGTEGFNSWSSYPQPLSLRGDTWWFHWDFVNASDVTETYRLLLGSPLLLHIDFFVIEKDQLVQGRAGAAVPVSQRLWSTREPTAQFSLAPGAQASVYVRLQTPTSQQLVPRLYTETAYQQRERRAALWDAALWGGLTALAWAALMVGLFARAWPFVLLGILCFFIVLFEAGYRGYTQFYWWPEAGEWAYRSVLVWGAGAVALFPFFVLGVARYEKVSLPWALALASLGVLQGCLAILALWAPYGLMSSLVSVTANVFLLAALAIAIRLMLGTLISARLMVLVMAFALFNTGLRTAEAYGVAPDFIMRWGFDLHPNPVVAWIGFSLNILLLAAWIHYVADQRLKARDVLIDWQAREQERLETEVQRQTTALRAALSDAEEKTRQKAQVLGYISHDLRTPLAAIASYSQVLPGTPPAEQTRHLKAIDRAVNYQLQLIDELLEFSREELQPLHIKPERTDLLELLQNVGDHAAGLAKRQSNQFLVEASTALPRWIEVDSRRLQQVLLNLLANAAKFTRHGQIRLLARADEQLGEQTEEGMPQWQLGLTVADSGIGIEAAQHQNVFKAFQQLQQAQGSVGLGLFIAQHIVDGMGGQLRLDSQPGQGSVFYVDLAIGVVGSDMVPPGVLQQDVWQSPEPLVVETLPPISLRAELVMLARSGRLSDIEAWIAQQRQGSPEWAPFLDEVQAALLELDFETIESLARINEEG